jgi:two-component system CheB/CheR fusion protein
VNQLFGQVRLRDAAFETSPVAQMAIDVNNVLVLANAQARSMFDLKLRDIGRPFQDLEMSYRPVELRSSMERSLRDRIPIILREVEWFRASGSSQYFDVRFHPLLDNGKAVLGSKSPSTTSPSIGSAEPV